MKNLYAGLIQAWERRLNRVDQDRRITPFDWGSEWLRRTPVNGVSAWAAEAAPAEVMPELREWNRRVLADSEGFFAYQPVREYRLRGGALSFRSPVETPYIENHEVHARWFPSPRAEGRAVVVVAQWNASEQGHLALCKLFQRCGISALRVSMPYHDVRMPRATKRAEYTVDANIGRTIHAARQAVCDIRASLDWLQEQGCDRLGICGTSLGSCYALLASAHDARLRVNVYNHVSRYFGDVVWTGLATAHVRRSLEPYIGQEALREAWRTISPASYLEQYAAMHHRAPKSNLLIWARFDPCFLPEYSRQVLAEFQRLGLPHEARALPCGHYTIGKLPFSALDAGAMARFLCRHL